MSDASDPAAKPPEQPSTPKRANDGPSRGDIAALGIGCLVVIIMAIAMIAVGMTRE